MTAKEMQRTMRALFHRRLLSSELEHRTEYRREPQMKQHIARKRFGQNFLTDQQVLNDIISCINLEKRGEHG